MSYKKKILPKADEMKFTEADLKSICQSLNKLLKFGAGIVFNMRTVQWWYTDSKYIDFNEALGKFQVLDKFERWEPPTDTFTVSITDL